MVCPECGKYAELYVSNCHFQGCLDCWDKFNQELISAEQEVMNEEGNSRTRVTSNTATTDYSTG